MNKSIFKRRLILLLIAVGFLGINALGYCSAYMLTNYRHTNKAIGLPRPTNDRQPENFQLQHSTSRLEINKQEWLELWTIESNSEPKGTIILFHGKDSAKSSLLDSAKVFNLLGYRSVLVDFRGSGGSSSSSTTIGVRESQDVALVFQHVHKLDRSKPTILYGVSMGTAAILKAIAQEKIEPDAIILELPFTSLLSAVRSRLNRSNLPPFPTAELIVFWGGIQNGFNGFAHNPLDYATKVKCSTLILQGGKDVTVDMQEIDSLYQNIDPAKKRVVFPEAGHQLLVTVNKELWQQNVDEFLNNIKSLK